MLELAAALLLAPGPLFEDATEAAGLRGVTSNAAVAFADFDADGDPDALIERTKVFLNERGRFVPVTQTAFPALPKAGHETAQIGDVNGDGFPDLFVGRYGGASEVLLGDGKGGFTRKERSGVEAYSESTVSSCFVDYDRDGKLDLWVANAYVEYGKGLEAFPDRLWRGRGDGTFEDVTERAGLIGVTQVALPESRRPTYGVAAADWNGDGWTDLIACSYGRQANRLWKNNGDGTFTDVAPEVGFDGDGIRHGRYPPAARGREDEKPFRSHGNTFDCAAGDFDNDGDLDFFLADITHAWAGESSDLSMLLVNEGKKLRRWPEAVTRTHVATHWNQGDIGADWIDVDNDGRLDLLVASSDYPDDQLLRLWHQGEGGTFTEWTDRLGFRWRNAVQISLGDFDRDGATDILAATNHSRLTAEQRKERDLNVGLFRNVAAAAAGNRFISIRAARVGTRVKVLAGALQQIREVQEGHGAGAHHDDPELRFGIGKAESVDVVVGAKRFRDVATNRFYRLDDGGNLRPIE
jgi:enediyne biosynthesis protein E4